MENDTALQRIQSILHSDQETLVLHCSNPNLKRDREEGETASIEDLRQENRDLLAKIQRLEGKLSAVEDNLKCNICFEKSEDDVLLKCGHNFCRPCLTSWSGTGRTAGRTCSLCRKPTSEANQSEHLAFRRVVEAVKYTKVYPNGEKYMGDLEGVKRHGQGTCVYPNGNKYEGGWREDSMFGQGVYTWKDGSFYKGEFVQGNKSAEGLMTWANGQTYKGKWRTPDSDDFIFFDAIANDDAEFLYENRNDGKGLHTWPDGKQFKGCFSLGMKYGHGEMTWPNGDKLTDEAWEEDCITKGTYIWHDGCKLPDVHTDWINNGIYHGFSFRDGDDDPVHDCDKVSSFWCYRKELGHHRGEYQGEWDSGNWFGKGKVIYPLINSEYEGEFKLNQRDGKGKEKNGDGSSYEGDWENNEMHGQGVKIWANGNRYEGSWKRGKRDGRGVMKYDRFMRGVDQGEKYDGEWKDDKKHGYGIYTGDMSNFRYEGQWENDRRHGRGTVTWGRDSNNVYDGEWKDGEYHGNGTLAYRDDGRKWEGQFVKGIMHGQVRHTSSKGDIYTGECDRGAFEGLGVIEYANGDRYEGLLHESQRQGNGKMTLASGVEEEGVWYDDEKLPDPSTVGTNELILLFVGMTPDFSKQFLIDAFRGRIAKNDDRPLSEPGDLAEVIVEKYKTHEIVAMLRDGDAFKEGIEFADTLLEDFQEVENDFEEDIPDVPNITVKDRIKRAENKFLGKEFPEHTLEERVAYLKDFLEH